jgi:hypothetical protein
MGPSIQHATAEDVISNLGAACPPRSRPKDETSLRKFRSRWVTRVVYLALVMARVRERTASPLAVPWTVVYWAMFA